MLGATDHYFVLPHPDGGKIQVVGSTDACLYFAIWQDQGFSVSTTARTIGDLLISHLCVPGVQTEFTSPDGAKRIHVIGESALKVTVMKDIASELPPLPHLVGPRVFQHVYPRFCASHWYKRDLPMSRIGPPGAESRNDIDMLREPIDSEVIQAYLAVVRETMLSGDIVTVEGPSGSGKTVCAMQSGLHSLYFQATDLTFKSPEGQGQFCNALQDAQNQLVVSMRTRPPKGKPLHIQDLIGERVYKLIAASALCLWKALDAEVGAEDFLWGQWGGYAEWIATTVHMIDRDEISYGSASLFDFLRALAARLPGGKIPIVLDESHVLKMNMDGLPHPNDTGKTWSMLEWTIYYLLLMPCLQIVVIGLSAHFSIVQSVTTAIGKLSSQTGQPPQARAFIPPTRFTSDVAAHQLDKFLTIAPEVRDRYGKYIRGRPRLCWGFIADFVMWFEHNYDACDSLTPEAQLKTFAERSRYKNHVAACEQV